jgi:hypothetical protein
MLAEPYMDDAERFLPVKLEILRSVLNPSDQGNKLKPGGKNGARENVA